MLCGRSLYSFPLDRTNQIPRGRRAFEDARGGVFATEDRAARAPPLLLFCYSPCSRFVMEMKKRISLELRNRSPAEVGELVVDNCRCSDGEVEGLSEEFTELEVLSMANVGLSSLAKMPPLPKLQKLEVSENAISGGLNALVEKCPGLTHLNLSSNKLKELSSLEPLQGLKALKSLDLYGCDVSSLDDYRERVFQLLPQLTYLDGFDQEDNEASDNDEEEEAGPHGDDGEEEDDEDEGSEGEEDEVGLSYLMKEGIQDEDDDGDYVQGEEEEEEDEDEDGGETVTPPHERRRSCSSRSGGEEEEGRRRRGG
ncbi:Acidic leucine-rich nuclear phosphoprotein 32 family member E [Oryzias melastigma]|uniref:Acidic leucine-rich nuclear phosphoprotein 32 family member n=3 Tax=Oryzias melastigma TaxID=30732 RepID=A0A834CMJ4_ORYME|nr:Acidic leucine-rich nuclear phosphoprotein 32 family member E [Oryzias melastigma]